MMEKRENDEMDGSWWKLEAQKIQDNSGSCFYKVLAVALWVAGALFLLSSITSKARHCYWSVDCCNGNICVERG